jgi:hypothetical protein
MNCQSVRAKLPELLYGDLKPEEAADVQHHLQSCSGCRHEEAALRQVRRLLDAAPEPQITVNVAGIYRQGAEAQQRRVRRWRRAAVLAFGAAAAVAAIAVLPRFEIRLDGRQLVLRWANPPAVETPAPALAATSQTERFEPRSSPHLEEQVQVLNELILGQREEMAQLQTELVKLRQQVAAGTQRWLTAERDIAALSSSQLLTKGDSHD